MDTTVSTLMASRHHQDPNEIGPDAEGSAAAGVATRQSLPVRYARDVWRLPAYSTAVIVMRGANKMRALGMFLDSDPGKALSSRSRDVLRALVKIGGPRDTRRFEDGRVVTVVYAGVEYLTRHLGPKWSTSTTKRALAELVKAGVVTRTRSFRLNTVTVVELPSPDAVRLSRSTPPTNSPIAADGPTSRTPDEPTSRTTDEPTNPRSVKTRPVQPTTPTVQTTPATTVAAVLETPPNAVGWLVGDALETKGNGPDADAAAVAAVREALMANGIRGRVLDELAASGIDVADVTTTAREIHASRNVGNLAAVLVHRLRDLAATVHERNEIRRAKAAEREAAKAARDLEADAADPAAWSRHDAEAWGRFLYVMPPDQHEKARRGYYGLTGINHVTNTAAAADPNFRRFVVDVLRGKAAETSTPTPTP